MKAPARRRCAVYTRKSTDEGLEQDFNSLHAQREACEAYVLSQAGEGWEAVATQYDDGGYSGGTLERPALRRLLADIDAGRIDIIVVYNVDRLTRSLADFAKIVERLDAAGASFVSVTQAFNTTNSMGRLTLNVLLSFAQFEREVTGERIRDKIALSKARGIWMGGMVPLGYDLKDRHLIRNEAEARTVREIFERYLQLKSVNLLAEELDRSGVRSKAWQSRRGRAMGGAAFSRGSLFHLLQNRLYVGEIKHRDQAHRGRHEPILDEALFEAVQRQLAAGATAFKERPIRAAQSALVGRLFDADGNRMGPNFSYGRRGRPYRYYVSMNVQAGRTGASGDLIRRLNADAVENFLLAQIRRLSGQAELQVAHLSRLVRRVELGVEETQMVVDLGSLRPDQHAEFALADLSSRTTAGEQVVWEDQAASLVRIRLPLRMKLRGGRTWIDAGRYPVVTPKVDKGLAQGLRTAHRKLGELKASPLTDLEAFSSGVAPENPHDRQVSRLAFLAPDLQRLILEGRQPAGLTLRKLLKSELPLAWDDQRRWFVTLARA